MPSIQVSVKFYRVVAVLNRCFTDFCPKATGVRYRSDDADQLRGFTLTLGMLYTDSAAKLEPTGF